MNDKAAVQNCKRAKRLVHISRKQLAWLKRHANRQHRRALNAATSRIKRGWGDWDSEAFDTPRALTDWEIA